MNLSKDWITSGLIDFEYKKYVLLAYFQKVKASFDEQKLYPFLSDLYFHYKNLIELKEKKQLIYEKFPQKISKADFEKLKITYQKMINDSDVMKELQDIADYAEPLFKRALDKGRGLYEEIEDRTEIQSVGVVPLYANEGYFFIQREPEQSTRIFKYSITMFENNEDVYRGINAEYLGVEQYQLSNTFEHMKLNLIRTYKQMPNPATYLIRIKDLYPLEESVMPIAKRLLVRYINNS